MIFFFYGDDTYRAWQKVKQIKDKFRAEVDKSGFNTLVIDGSEMTLEQFNEAVSQAGFLADKRLIVIKNIFNHKGLSKIKDDLIAYLNKQTDSSDENFLLFWQDGKPDKRSSLFKKLATYKYVNEFEPLNDYKLNVWAKAEIDKLGGKITTPALNMLTANVGNNLWLLSSEINKLVNYKNGQNIIEQDIELLTRGKLDENIFNLTDAIASQQSSKAIKLLKDQLDQGSNEQYLLTMILRQFRILLQLKSLITSNNSANEINKATGLHPFVIKKSLPLLSKYSMDDLKRIFNRLVQLDLDMKSSPLDNELFLDLFIIKTPRK
ncbi:DNA polymerase III subunit delta [Patescibacteria group bacterium]|nr:DNA polymerase III subunit delta [Patescibacteria group bacterium]